MHNTERCHLHRLLIRPAMEQLGTDTSAWRNEEHSSRTLFAMRLDHRVLFGLGLENGVHQVNQNRCGETVVAPTQG
jgi:hypothetical protein